MEFYTRHYFFIKQKQSVSHMSWTTVKPVKRGWYFCQREDGLEIVGFVSRNALLCYHIRNGFDCVVSIRNLVGEKWSRCVPQPEYNHEWFCGLPTRAKKVLLESSLHVNRKILSDLNKNGELRSVILKVKNCGVATYGHIVKAISRKQAGGPSNEGQSIKGVARKGSRRRADSCAANTR